MARQGAGSGGCLWRQGYLLFHSLELNMNTLMTAARQFARDEEGITAIEYGLIAAVMAAAIAAAFAFLSPALKTAFQNISEKINPP